MQLLTAGTRQVNELAFAPDGLALVASCARSAPQLWSLPAVGDPTPLSAVAHHCYAFTFAPDASALGWLANYKRMEHDRRTGTTREANITAEGEVIMTQATCGTDGRLVVRTTQRGVGYGLRALVPDAPGGWSDAWRIGPNDTGGWRLAGSRADRFFLWESAFGRESASSLVVYSALTGEPVARTRTPTYYALGFVASPDGSALVLFKDSSLHFWKVGEKVVKVRTDTLKHYRSVAFHPDGRHLLAGNNDTTARLIDTHTWQVVRQYTWDVGELSAVAVSPDGNLAAAGGRKGRVVVWDLDL